MPFFTRSRVLLISWGVNPGDYETTGQGAHSKHRLAGRLKDIATRTFREKEQQMKPRLCIAIACAVACVTCVRNSQAGEVPFGAIAIAKFDSHPPSPLLAILLKFYQP